MQPATGVVKPPTNQAPLTPKIVVPKNSTRAATPGKPKPIEEEPSEEELIALIELAASAEASPQQLALLNANRERWLSTLDTLLEETEEILDELRGMRGPERAQIVADFDGERQRLKTALELLEDATSSTEAIAVVQSPGETHLHLSWANPNLVAWSGGPAAPSGNEKTLRQFLADLGAPTDVWQEHDPVNLPGNETAFALSTSIAQVLGWLAVIGGNNSSETYVSPSVLWLARVVAWGVQLVAQGAVVPTVQVESSAPKGQPSSSTSNVSLRWQPALVETKRLEGFTKTMPGPVTAVAKAQSREIVKALLSNVVHAIVSDSASRLSLPAPPPNPQSTSDVAEALLTRLDGSVFTAPHKTSSEVASRIDRWARPVTDPISSRLLVTLDPPDSGGAWFLSVQHPTSGGEYIPVEVALIDARSKRQTSSQLDRLERLLPALKRPGALRRGQVYLAQDEAWELMTKTGPLLQAAGFDVRVPALSRRRPSPTLRLSTESTESVVGANQLTNVRWSAVFDDVELTAAEITALASEARPLIRSHGRWVELDRADLAEAAAALAEHSQRTQMTGAEVLRFGVGLDGSGLSGGITVVGNSWAADLLERASTATTEPITKPQGFKGELRSYQAEALGWLSFLDSVELGGCLALDMGLGKTPTVLGHLARTRGEAASLIIVPPAIVGNWASEAARFAPQLRVLIHHGPNRLEGQGFKDALAGTDLVITTYGTAVRDLDLLANCGWRRMILDEAQAIKNPTNETSHALRQINADMRLALTGTPVENGLGDLWAILDFTNPGLVGSRSTFVAQLSTNTSPHTPKGAEAGLRALNGILIFRRTKAEPAVAAELPDRIDELDHCSMTPEQIGLYQAVLDKLVAPPSLIGEDAQQPAQGQILAAITALKQICNHPAAYEDDGRPLHGRSGKLTRLEEIVRQVYASEERVLIFTHFARWGMRLADHLTEEFGHKVECYHGGLSRTERDRIVREFQTGEGPGALVLSLKAGGTGLNLTAASHVVLYDRWWNPAVEDQARDRAWRIGQTRTVVSRRLVCPGTIDERVEEVVAGKRHIANMVLPKSSSLSDLDAEQLRSALGLRTDSLLVDDEEEVALV